MAASAPQGWFLKGCLVATGVAGLAVALLIGGYYWSKLRRERQAALDEVRYSAVCDTIRYVTEQPTVSFDGFDPDELPAFTFYLVRGGRVLQDTTVPAGRGGELAALHVPLPFARFRKTDTIGVATAGSDRRFYLLSDFHHYAYLHYGMLGYVGSHDCRFADGQYVVNGRPYDGFLHKQAGRRTLALPTRRTANRPSSPRTPARQR